MKAKKTNKIISLVVMIALVAGIVTPIAMVPVSAAPNGEERVYNFEQDFVGNLLTTDKFFSQIKTDRFPLNGNVPGATTVDDLLAGNSLAAGSIQLDVVSTASAPNRVSNNNGEPGNYQSLKVQSPKSGSNFKIKPENVHPLDELVASGNPDSAYMTFYAKSDTPMNLVASACIKDQVFSKSVLIDSNQWKKYKVKLTDMRCSMEGHTFGEKDFITITKEGGWSGGLQEAFFCYFMFATPESAEPITYFLDSLAFEGEGVKPYEGGLYGTDKTEIIDGPKDSRDHNDEYYYTTMLANYNPTEETLGWKGGSAVSPKPKDPSSTPTSGSSSKPNGTNPGTSNSSGQTTTPDGNLILKDDVNNVSVEAAKGILPEGSTLAVKAITDGDSYTKAQTALKSMNPKSFTLYDIAVLKDGTAVTFNGKVKVTMPIPQGYDTDKLGVFNIGDDGKLTEMTVSIGEGTLSFETEHFSLYTIADLVGGGSSAVAPTSSSEDTAKKGMSKTTLIIIIVAAAVVLLLGGGAAYYFLVMKKKDTVDTETTEIPENTVDAENTENKTNETENK